jgi:hypothetical protein
MGMCAPATAILPVLRKSLRERSFILTIVIHSDRTL